MCELRVAKEPKHINLNLEVEPHLKKLNKMKGINFFITANVGNGTNANDVKHNLVLQEFNVIDLKDENDNVIGSRLDQQNRISQTIAELNNEKLTEILEFIKSKLNG